MISAYEELIDFIIDGPTPRRVADFHPSEAAKARAGKLILRQTTSGLSAEENDELTEYLSMEHNLRMAKARAHQHLAWS